MSYPIGSGGSAYPMLPGEVGVRNPVFPWGDVRRYGAVADDGRTDNRPLIQNAIDSAWSGGAGFARVYVPSGQGHFYGMIGALYARSEVEMTGDGPASYIRNVYEGVEPTKPGDSRYKPAMERQGCVFRLGGVEGASPYWLQDDPYDVITGVRAGQSWVDVNAVPANVTAPFDGTWTAGDVVYLRTEEHDPEFRQKELPLYFEANEIVAISPRPAGSSGVRLTLRYALRNDYANGRAILHGHRGDECNPGPADRNPCAPDLKGSALKLKIETLKRFRLRNLKLDASHPDGPPVLGYGGCFECELTNLWVDGSGELMQLNAMSRCRFEGIRGRFFKGMGELAYFSHGNVFRSLHVTQFADPASGPRNGFNLTEHAGDNLLDDVHLDFNGSGGYPLVLEGRNNRVVNSTVSAGAGALAVIVLAACSLRYKPRHCTLENVTVRLPGDTQSLFGVVIDSGGPYGGFNTVRGLTVVGRPLVAAVGFTRFDIMFNHPAATPCENNLVDGVSVVSADETGSPSAPANATVVDVYNAAPGPNGEEMIIDAWATRGPNLVVNARTPTVQRVDRRFNLGAATVGAKAAVGYVVPAASAGTHTSWHVRAAGHAQGGQDAVVGTLELSVGGTPIWNPGLTPGSWSLEAVIGGTIPTGGSIAPASLLMGTQMVSWAGTANGAPARGTATLNKNLNTNDLSIDVSAVVQTGSGTITIDEWSVVPAGDQVGFVNWELLKTLYGSYPPITDPCPPSPTTPASAPPARDGD